MLDHIIAEEIKKREEAQKEVQLELPLEMPRYEEEILVVQEEQTDRGVTIIEY